MKKMAGILMAIIFSLTLLMGCDLSNKTTVSRLQQSGDWIYYTNLKEEALYKMKTDWTEKTKFPASIGTDYMVIEEDYIYYFDGDKDISKIKTDGTAQTKVVDVNAENMFGFYVSGDWIYYIFKPGSIYKIKTDGTEETKIADIPNFKGDLKIAGDWIYYKDGISLFKMRTDGMDAVKLLDNVSVYEIKDDWIYYGMETEQEEAKNLHRMKLDGSEKTQLSDGTFTAIDGEWLYYSKKDGLYRANLDGSAAEKMNDVEMWQIYGIYGDHIYYGEYSGAAYRINLDGSNKMRVE